MTFIQEQEPSANGTVEFLANIGHDVDNVQESRPGAGKVTMRTKFEREEVTTEGALRIGNLRGAETLVLTEGEVFWAMGTPPLNHISDEAKLAHRITHAMARISVQASRGAANTVIYNPACAEKIQEAIAATRDQEVPKNPLDPNCQETTTVQVPYFAEDAVEWIEHDAAPDDAVLVMYRGKDATDQPFVYVDGTGLVLNNARVDVDSYGKFVRIP